MGKDDNLLEKSRARHRCVDMVRIAICDNDIQEIENLCVMIKENHEISKFYNIQYTGYVDPHKLLEDLELRKEYDVFLLDMLMLQMNGIKLAKEIMKHVDKPLILFMTHSKDYALQAYGVHALRYLLKPVQAEELAEALQFALARKEIAEENRRFSVKTANGIVSVKIKEIMYCECTRRALHVHTVHGEDIGSIFLRGAFEDEIPELLGRKDFIQVHKSYVVNMDYIQSLQAGKALLPGDCEIPVSRSRQNETKRRYLEYLADKNRQGDAGGYSHESNVPQQATGHKV